MIALATDTPPAIIECREYKPASAREYPQFSIAFGSRSANLGAGDGSFAMQGDELVLGPLSRQQERMDPPPAASELPAEPPAQSAPLQHGRRAHRRRLDRTVLRRFCCALSRRHYDQLGALEPGLSLVRPFWRSKELRARQILHDLPPLVV